MKRIIQHYVSKINGVSPPGVHIIAVFAIVALSMWRSLGVLPSMPITPDEVSWFYHTEFYQLLHSGDLQSPKWQSYESYDHPPVAKYIYGFVLAQIYETIDVDRTILIQSYGRWSQYVQNEWQDNTQIVGAVEVMRYVSAVCIMTFLLLVYWLVYVWFGNSLLSYSSSMILLYYPQFFSNMSLATSESILYVLIGLALICYTYVHRSGKLKYISVVAAICGLAVASKLTALLCVLTICVHLAISDGGALDRQRIVALGQFVLVMFFVWVVINPTLYKDPIIGTSAYVSFRIEQIEKQKVAFENQSLKSFREKSVAAFCHMIMCEKTPAMHVFAGLELSLIFLGCADLFEKAKNNSRANFSVITVLLFIASAFMAPFDWYRYYIPSIIAITIIKSLGFYKFIYTSKNML